MLISRNYRVMSVAWSQDGTLATGSRDNTLRIWSEDSTGTFQCKSTLYGHSAHNPECTCQHYDEDGDEDYEADPHCPVTGHSAP